MENKINRIILAELIIMTVISIDLISTAIGFKYGYSEMNNFMGLFFKFGLIGFILAFIFDIVLFSLVLIFLPKLWNWIYKLREKKQMSKKFDNILFWIVAIGITLFEVYTVIGNIITISG